MFYNLFHILLLKFIYIYIYIYIYLYMCVCVCVCVRLLDRENSHPTWTNFLSSCPCSEWFISFPQVKGLYLEDLFWISTWRQSRRVILHQRSIRTWMRLERDENHVIYCLKIKQIVFDSCPVTFQRHLLYCQHCVRFYYTSASFHI